MNDTNDFYDDTPVDSPESCIAQLLLRLGLGGWFLFCGGLFLLFGAGISTAPLQQGDFLTYFLTGAFLVGFSLLVALKVSGKIKIIAAIFAALVFLVSACIGSFYIPIEDYERAVTYMEKGDYARAQELFEDLSGFRDSSERAAECKGWVQYMKENKPGPVFFAPDYDEDYARALEYMAQGRYELARVWFNWLGDCRDSREKAQECANYIEYERIMSTAEQSPERIYKDLRQLRGFPPADAVLATPEYQAIREEMLKTGGSVVFGQWSDQDGIVWEIIARDGDRALLLCSNPQTLDSPTSMANIPWGESDLRQWLNQDFLQKHFTPAQQALIIPTTLDNGGNGSPDTQDLVFLLSSAEVKQYLPSESARFVSLSIDRQYYYDWMLRVTGTPTDLVRFVDRSGEILATSVKYGSRSKQLIRPAMWIILTPDIY